MIKQPRLEEVFQQIIDVVTTEFSDITVDAQLRYTPSGATERLRIFLIGETYLDIWLSQSGKYAYHWEQRQKRGCIHRHDNAPHKKWNAIKTFPKHFHDGNENNVKESNIPGEPTAATRYFLYFVRDSIKKR
jgi:hypothetical protein